MHQKFIPEVLITHKDRRVCISCGRWFGKIIRERDYEFQEPTLRPVRRDNLSGESQGDREEFQPEETKDDAEAREDFRSFKEISFIVNIIEPRVQFFRAERRIIPYST